MKMEVTSATKSTVDTQAVVTTDETEETTVVDDSSSVETTDDEFSAFIRKALGGSAKTEVNEEELFAALIGERLQDVSDEAANFYNEQKASLMVSMARDDGYVPVEDVAVAALKATVEEGLVDEETAEQINGQAFMGAQLDDNTDALYDSYGSAGDQTIATSEMEAALLAMRTLVEQIDNGEVECQSRSLDTPSNSISGSSSSGEAPSGSQTMDGDGGFLWKPVSESDGNLVVLLPTTLKDAIDKVEIHSSLPPDSSTLIEEGSFAGDEHNGGRPHYRFDLPGSDYGDDVYVVVYKTDGETVTWEIGDGSQRYD